MCHFVTFFLYVYILCDILSLVIKMNILICDDNENTLIFLNDLITQKYGAMHQLFLFSNASDLLKFSGRADLLLSDIKLDDDNGIEVCHKFLAKYPNVKIIFITGYPIEYYQEIFNYFRPYGFIGKPIQADLLFQRIDNVNRKLHSNQMLEFMCKGNSILINPNKIVYIESHGRQKFITTKKDTYIINMSFDKIEDMLPNFFMRCHNAFIINMKYIDNYKNDNIAIANGKIIPIGRKYKQKFKNDYFSYKENENA